MSRKRFSGSSGFSGPFLFFFFFSNKALLQKSFCASCLFSFPQLLITFLTVLVSQIFLFQMLLLLLLALANSAYVWCAGQYTSSPCVVPSVGTSVCYGASVPPGYPNPNYACTPVSVSIPCNAIAPGSIGYIVGDPAPGTIKACFYYDASAPDYYSAHNPTINGYWTQCPLTPLFDAQRQLCTPPNDGTPKVVRFGVPGAYYYRTIAAGGTVPCFCGEWGSTTLLNTQCPEPINSHPGGGAATCEFFTQDIGTE